MHVQTWRTSCIRPLAGSGGNVRNLGFGNCHRQRHQCRKAVSQSAESQAPVDSEKGQSDHDLRQSKAALLDAVRGTDRGIFGIPAQDRDRILSLATEVEGLNPLPDATRHLDRVAGRWRLLFSTITILGRTRTKLGLRDFIALGDFTQSIDTTRSLAVNDIAFSVAGLGMLRGGLRIEAAYTPVSDSRVDIEFQSATLEPKQLNALFEKNYDLLLSIFNPDGWLEITFVDEQHRLGRDDKGNVFLLERMQ